MSNISANVSRLRFMHSDAIGKGQTGDNWSKIFVTEPDWCLLSKEEINSLERLPQLTVTLPKIKVKVMARRSYRGFNPVIENHQKAIRARKQADVPMVDDGDDHQCE